MNVRELIIEQNEKAKALSPDVIELANDIMRSFRDNNECSYENGKELRVHSSRLGILKTDLSFEAASKIISKSIELLRKEYKDELYSISNLGMYFTLKSAVHKKGFNE